jgi:hypothetical protein
MYPDADDGASWQPRGTGDSQSEWITKEDIRLAEYFYTVREKAKLVLLSDGTHVLQDETAQRANHALGGYSDRF